MFKISTKNKFYFFLQKEIYIKSFLKEKFYLLSTTSHNLFIYNFKNKPIYLKLPLFFNIQLKDNHRLFISFLNNNKFQRFYYFLLSVFNNNNLIYSHLMLRGHGYKVFYYFKSSLLNLKVGLTHRQYINFVNQENLAIFYSKPVLSMISINYNLINFFVYKLKHFRSLNLYTSSGIFGLKYRFKLKPIKK